MSRLIVLVKAWIEQQPIKIQNRLAGSYMVDHIAGLEMELRYIGQLALDPNYAGAKSWHLEPPQAGSPRRRRLRRSTVEEDQAELLKRLIEWWTHYEVSNVRTLAHAHFGINQIPELTDTLFNPWHHEFVQPLMAWALGTDTSEVFRLPPPRPVNIKRRRGRTPD